MTELSSIRTSWVEHWVAHCSEVSSKHEGFETISPFALTSSTRKILFRSLRKAVLSIIQYRNCQNSRALVSELTEIGPDELQSEPLIALRLNF